MSPKAPLGEEEVIQLLWRTMGRKRDPFNDDVAWTELAKKSRLKNASKRMRETNGKLLPLLISKSDMFVSGTDLPKRMTTRQAALKSITAAVSDFAAKGARPSYFHVSIGLPGDFATVENVRGLGLGFSDACTIYGLEILGGDINATREDLVIDCSMYGLASSIVKRSGAKPGDRVSVSGTFGLQSAGLRLLDGRARASSRRFERQAVNSVLNPRARLHLGLKIARLITSSTDSSDGLALSLYHLAESSRVDIEIDTIPLANGVEGFAHENALDPEELGLFGGEEYELVFTHPPDSSPKLKRMQNGVLEIGRVRTLSQDGSPKVFTTVGGSVKIIPRRGWLHLSSGAR